MVALPLLLRLRRFVCRFGRPALLAAGLALFARPLLAQNLLYIEYNGKYVLVRRAIADKPYVRTDDGKWEEVIGSHFLLKDGGEYLPFMVEAKNVAVAIEAKDLVDTGQGDMHNTDAMVADGRELNSHYVFSADLKSSRGLDDVFIMLALESDKGGGGLILRGIGRLEPNRVLHIAVPVPPGFDPTKVHITPHLFVGGTEVLNSAMPAAEVDKALDRMVAKHIAGVSAAEVRPFVGPPLDYPDALVKSGQTGQATVAFKVGRRGEVTDPVVTAASDPAFGQAAVEAIRQWRFLPRVVGGKPVDATAEIPFTFAPPS